MESLENYNASLTFEDLFYGSVSNIRCAFIVKKAEMVASTVGTFPCQYSVHVLRKGGHISLYRPAWSCPAQVSHIPICSQEVRNKKWEKRVRNTGCPKNCRLAREIVWQKNLTLLWKDLDAKPYWLDLMLLVHRSWWKSVFCWNTLRSRKVSTGNFYPGNPYSGFRLCIWWRVRSLRFQVIAAQSETIEAQMGPVTITLKDP